MKNPVMKNHVRRWRVARCLSGCFPALLMTALLISAAADAIAQPNPSRPEPQAVKPSRFDLARIDEPVVKAFRHAWLLSGVGASDIEAVVLIYKKADGSYKATSLSATNEPKQFTFTWNSAVIAIVHTHPNACGAKPASQDMSIADKYHVPMFTITSRGMFMYDPDTKKVSKVQDGLDWLDPNKWTRRSRVAANP